MMEKRGNKRGQIAIFVIVALVIVGIILVVWLYPGIRTLFVPKIFTPGNYLQSCVEPVVKTSIATLAKQSGYSNPEGIINYKGDKVKYLCHTSGYFVLCVVQQPMIKAQFESELSKMITPVAEKCMQNLKAEYEKRGYTTTLGKVSSVTLIEPQRVRIAFNAPMTVNKEGVAKFDKFDVEIKSEIYNLLIMATTIVAYEASYGDSETTEFMLYYPDLKINKILLEDGVKIYKLNNVVTNETFQFATRSLVFPPGYGLT